jgi:murein L,D-transpeptidase YafK
VKLGLDPYGDKVREGDWCMPEGEFYICSKNPQSKYQLSLGLNYPNKEDAERGRRDKLITRQQYREIVRRIEKKSIPPWNIPLGAEIFIHGDGENRSATYGCVALNNKDIKELFLFRRNPGRNRGHYSKIIPIPA